MKKALITGVYGQDGSFLAELLLQKGYHVLGVTRDNLSENSCRIKEELNSKGVYLSTKQVDILDYYAVGDLISEYKPDECYHLAASHFSAEDASSDSESAIFSNNIKATANILENCYKNSPHTHVVSAGSCLMFDGMDSNRQSLNDQFNSISYYGIAKISENMLTRMFRKKGLFACTAILYNHESHRRSDRFVTQKIVKNMIAIKKGEIDSFTLGALDTYKDWGYAKDYAEAMYLMANGCEAKDYIISTDSLHTIKDFVEECARQLAIDDWEDHITIDSGIIARKSQVVLRGDCSPIEKELGWKRTVDFKGLVGEMINAYI